jgi:hypothetical protein
MQEDKGMGWLRTFFARREMRRKVDWKSCEWSPQKAGEKRFKENMLRHYKELIGIQTEWRLSLWQTQKAGIMAACNGSPSGRSLKISRYPGVLCGTSLSGWLA